MESQESVTPSEEWASESSEEGEEEEEEEGDDYSNYYGDEDPDAGFIAAGIGIVLQWIQRMWIMSDTCHLNSSTSLKTNSSFPAPKPAVTPLGIPTFVDYSAVYLTCQVYLTYQDIPVQ